MTIKRPFTYPADHLSKISFPLGGIGTVSIGLYGARLLIDWEIFNRPAKGIGNVLSYFAIKAECDCKVLDKHVLNGLFSGDLAGDYRAVWNRGYGSGGGRDLLAGVPHFERAVTISPIFL